MSALLLESCVESVDAALAAEAKGAGRIELCTQLSVEGLTPDRASIEVACASCSVPVFVMIRPRAGDFCYSPEELETMEADIHAAKELGAHGIVVGALNPDRTINQDALTRLRAAAGDRPVTFHRAFDVVPEPLDSLELLIDLGVDRVLTSGQADSAREGIALIAELVRVADGRTIIMPGGGVRAHNYRDIVAATNVCEIHSSQSWSLAV